MTYTIKDIIFKKSFLDAIILFLFKNKRITKRNEFN
jgi:hypothetical protein